MADPGPQALVSHVTAEIMAYLKLYPGAGDTIPGIRRWWLAATRDEVGFDTVEAALERLVAQGAMGVRVLVSGERFYFGPGDAGKGSEREAGAQEPPAGGTSLDRSSPPGKAAAVLPSPPREAPGDRSSPADEAPGDRSPPTDEAAGDRSPPATDAQGDRS